MSKIYLFILVAAAAIILAVVYATRNVSPDNNDNSILTGDSSTTVLSPTKGDNNMKLTSSAFENMGSIPVKYTCDTEKFVSPPLGFSDVPTNTRSLALIVDDPDVPKQLRPSGVFDHWVLFNIQPTATGIGEGQSAGTSGANGTGKTGYVAPCPPPQYQPNEHRYVFTLYALDAILTLKEGASKEEVLSALKGHVLSTAVLTGKYRKQGAK